MIGLFDKGDNLSETGHGIDKESNSYEFDKKSSDNEKVISKVNTKRGPLFSFLLAIVLCYLLLLFSSFLIKTFSSYFNYNNLQKSLIEENTDIDKDALLQTGINFIKNNKNKIICIIQRDDKYEFFSNNNEWITLFDLSSSNLPLKDIKFYIKTEVYNKLKDLDFLSENWYKLDNNIEKGNIFWINKENIESINVYSSHISFKLKNNKISPSCPISNLYLIDSEQITNDYRNQDDVDVDSELYEIIRRLFE